jgi:hypothetical protein
MIAINLTTYTHGDITDLTKKFVLVSFMMVTKAKIENGIILDNLPLMFGGNLILMMLIVTFLTEINLLREAINIALGILALLALDLLDLFMRLLFVRKLYQVVW